MLVSVITLKLMTLSGKNNMIKLILNNKIWKTIPCESKSLYQTLRQENIKIIERETFKIDNEYVLILRLENKNEKH